MNWDSTDYSQRHSDTRFTPLQGFHQWLLLCNARFFVLLVSSESNNNNTNNNTTRYEIQNNISCAVPKQSSTFPHQSPSSHSSPTTPHHPTLCLPPTSTLVLCPAFRNIVMYRTPWIFEEVESIEVLQNQCLPTTKKKQPLVLDPQYVSNVLYRP